MRDVEEDDVVVEEVNASDTELRCAGLQAYEELNSTINSLILVYGVPYQGMQVLRMKLMRIYLEIASAELKSAAKCPSDCIDFKV